MLIAQSEQYLLFHNFFQVFSFHYSGALDISITNIDGLLLAWLNIRDSAVTKEGNIMTPIILYSWKVQVLSIDVTCTWRIKY